MSNFRRHFSKEEKLEIVRQSMEDAVSVGELAEQYKVNANTISKWRSEYLHHGAKAFPGQGNKVLSDEQREIEALKKQLREAELEKEILKKALGIFSSPNRKNLHL
jgi:transposase